MKILVTGTAGFIGSHVTEALLARGDTVAGIDSFSDQYDPARKRANIAALMPKPRFLLHEADVRNAEAMRRVFSRDGFDAVVHLAAMVGGSQSVEKGPLYAEVNVQGTVNILEAARLAGIPHVVFASTSSVYGCTGLIPFREDDRLGHPLTPYPATKIAGEVMGHAYSNLFELSFTALRLFSIYGPRGRSDMMPYHITDCIVHGREFTLYEAGQMYRDWAYIDDVVQGILAAVDRPNDYMVVNLGYGKPVRMGGFVALVEEMVGKPAQMTSAPAPASEPPITYADLSKARDVLDYTAATPIEEGMRQFWEWYQAEILNPG
jgi:UDP-glucuronate 4-epimerase